MSSGGGVDLGAGGLGPRPSGDTADLPVIRDDTTEFVENDLPREASCTDDVGGPVKVPARDEDPWWPKEGVIKRPPSAHPDTKPQTWDEQYAEMKQRESTLVGQRERFEAAGILTERDRKEFDDDLAQVRAKIVDHEAHRWG